MRIQQWFGFLGYPRTSIVQPGFITSNGAGRQFVFAGPGERRLIGLIAFGLSGAVFEHVALAVEERSRLDVQDRRVDVAVDASAGVNLDFVLRRDGSLHGSEYFDETYFDGRMRLPLLAHHQTS